MFERLLLPGLCFVSGIAYFWPNLTSETAYHVPDVFVLGKSSLNYAICLTMFSVGWLLPKREVDELFRRWRLVVAGTAIQFVTMGLLAFAITRLVPLSSDLKTGIIIVGCVPGAMASNVLTMLANGNVSFSVSLTTLATLVSPIIVPLGLRLFLGQGFPVGQAFLLLVWTVVLPTILGHVCGRFFPKWQRRIKPIARNVASLAILWIIAVVVGLNRERFEDLTLTVFLALLLLNVGGYFSGYFAGGLFGMDERMCRALSLEVGMQNAGLGTSLAAEVFSDRPEILIPTALYTFGCMLTGTILAKFWGRRESKANGEID